jgi:hypothetical protein
MNAEDVTSEAFIILEEMVCHQIKNYKLQVNKENLPLIKELQRFAGNFGGFSWRFMGVVKGKRWFIVTDNSRSIFDAAPAGELIMVDFKAKKVLSRTTKVA